MQDVMLDLETWGTRPGCALRSVGAVQFDPHENVVHAKFYANVSLQSCLDAKLVQEQSTVDWWSRQTEDAQAALEKEQKELGDVLSDFVAWFRRIRAVRIWSHGANFDEPIIVAALDACGIRAPWKFWDVRCTRTFYYAHDFNPRTVSRAGTHHNALDDAVYQVHCVQRAAASGLDL